MDRGEFIKGGYTVEPGDGGSWVVRSHVKNFLIPAHRGFTNYRDLLDWLREEHECLAAPLTTVDPNEMDRDTANIPYLAGPNDIATIDIPKGAVIVRQAEGHLKPMPQYKAVDSIKCGSVVYFAGYAAAPFPIQIKSHFTEATK